MLRMLKNKGLRIFLITSLMIISFAPVVSAGGGTIDTSKFQPDDIAPTWGNTDVGYDVTAEERYIQHDYQWDEDGQVMAAYYNSNAHDGHSPSGMEIDTSFYNYECATGPGGDCVEYSTYAIEAKSESQSSSYWWSDAPEAYIDSSVLDKATEPTIGLGSGQWLSAEPGYIYTSGTYVEPGSQQNDRYKVTVSRVHHHDVAINCGGGISNPYCKYQDTPAVDVIDAWAEYTPDYDRNWQYPQWH
ncbi:hypothetical protein [Pontibacillus yanchengensis]|uniref:Uncharacterized protein n=2 Tax=Pontibacillus yanchengensis TaxID=462910 RepID=A0A6I5A4Z4_9BACI|nr:hypothetical protein [Pontibacillus yanchengensis]MYL35415.1 hypothetical protein [Pontibacillus yanchengensis]